MSVGEPVGFKKEAALEKVFFSAENLSTDVPNELSVRKINDDVTK
jgi:hypothetical protein